MTGFVSSAPGKLVLFGEYAVLEGAPALVTAVNRRARVRFERDDTDTLVLSAKPLGLRSFPILREGSPVPDVESERRAALVMQVLELMFTEFPAAQELLKGGHLDIDTQEMSLEHGGAKLGVGSSAAVAAALVSGIGFLLSHQSLESRKIFELAHRAHLAFQGGRGSGIDVAAASFGGVLAFRGSHDGSLPESEARTWPAGLRWQVVGTGSAASTSEFLTALRAWKDSNPNDYNSLMGEMRALSKTVADADEGAWIQWSLNWCELLETLGRQIGAPIMSEAHLRFRDFAVEHGLGYKPSGAGGGDAGFFILPEDRSLDEVCTLIKRRNIHMLPLSPDAHGVQVESLESSESQG